MSTGCYATVGGAAATRSEMAPVWLVRGDRAACGRLEDTRRAKRLWTDDGAELVSAHLSCFAFRTPGAGAELTHEARHRCADLGLPALFVAVAVQDAASLQETLGDVGQTVAPATVFGAGIETGWPWNINTAEILTMKPAASPSRAPQVTAHAERALVRIQIMDNPYLRALSDGSMSRRGFRVTQEQFFFAVTFFPRLMAALVGRIDNPHARLDILHNLVEEHGEFEPRAFHHNTFQEFLRRMGSDSRRLVHTAVWPELRAFNAVLTAACVLDELEVGIACMGVIEHAFAGISAAIGQAVVARGWVRNDRLIHYRLHAQVDERHAEEFFAVIEPRWRTAARRYYIEQGLELGAYIFDRLYRDLYERGARLRPGPEKVR